MCINILKTSITNKQISLHEYKLLKKHRSERRVLSLVTERNQSVNQWTNFYEVPRLVENRPEAANACAQLAEVRARTGAVT